MMRSIRQGSIGAVVLLLQMQAPLADAALRPPPSCDAVNSTTPPKPNENFEVLFQGIISLVKPFPDSNYRKAIVISTRFTSTPHDPELIIASTVNRNSLEDVTGRKPDCSSYKDHCVVPIKGLAFRIRGDAEACPVDARENFKEALDNLPRLSRLKGVHVTVKSSIYDDTVNSPEMGVFEIEGGNEIGANSFPGSGAFYRTDGSGQVAYYDNNGVASTDCLQFADVVTWRGRTIGRAVLEVSKSGDISQAAAWKSLVFDSGNDQPLKVELHNLSHDHMPDSTHVKLFQRMLEGDDLPVVCPCQGNHPVDCTATTLVRHRKRTASGDEHPENVVPGCSDTGWP